MPVSDETTEQVTEAESPLQRLAEFAANSPYDRLVLRPGRVTADGPMGMEVVEFAWVGRVSEIWMNGILHTTCEHVVCLMVPWLGRVRWSIRQVFPQFAFDPLVFGLPVYLAITIHATMVG